MNTNGLREAYTTAWNGLNALYGCFDCLTYSELVEMRKKLDANYKAQFDELRQSDAETRAAIAKATGK